jgi:threonine/homoserine/homoserine lactone efflux protein
MGVARSDMGRCECRAPDVALMEIKHRFRSSRLVSGAGFPGGFAGGRSMTGEQGLAFLAFALVAAITPGPSNVMITATGAAVGVARGFGCALGAAAGMAALLFCAALGLGGVMAAAPVAVRVANLGGAAFLLWLAWKIATAEGAPESGGGRAVGFLGAAAFQWINPKGWLVALGAAATYLHGSGGLREAVWFGVLIFAAALPSGVAWLVLGASLQRLLRGARARRAFNVGMGVALAGSVVAMVW